MCGWILSEVRAVWVGIDMGGGSCYALQIVPRVVVRSHCWSALLNFNRKNTYIWILLLASTLVVKEIFWPRVAPIFEGEHHRGKVALVEWVFVGTGMSDSDKETRHVLCCPGSCAWIRSDQGVALYYLTKTTYKYIWISTHGEHCITWKTILKNASIEFEYYQ